MVDTLTLVGATGGTAGERLTLQINNTRKSKQKKKKYKKVLKNTRNAASVLGSARSLESQDFFETP